MDAVASWTPMNGAGAKATVVSRLERTIKASTCQVRGMVVRVVGGGRKGEAPDCCFCLADVTIPFRGR